MLSYILGWVYLVLPDAAPSIKNAPYSPSDQFGVALAVWTANFMKWDFFMFVNFWTFSSFPMSSLDIIFWEWPWPALYFFYESIWLPLYANAVAWIFFFWLWWLYIFYWPSDGLPFVTIQSQADSK